MRRVHPTLRLIQRQLEELDDEPQLLIRNANDIAANVNQKMDQLNPFFSALSNVGAELENRSSKLRDCCQTKSFKAQAQVALESPKEELVSDFIELALVGINIWKKIKK
jgi:uncharacterized protein YoxC